MKILVIASDKQGHFAPFIEEQITALEAIGIQIVRYGVTGHGIMGYLRELPSLRRKIRAERPDIVHAHYGLSGLLANLQRLVPVVTTYHGSDINLPNIRRFSKIAMRLSAHNIFVSKRSVALALGEAQAQCKVESVKCKGEENGKAETPASTLYTLHPTQTEASTPYTLHPTPKHTLLPCGVNLPQPWNEMQTQWVEQLTLNQWVQEKLKADVKHVLFAGAFDNAVKDAPLAKAAINELAIEGVKAELVELKGYHRDQVNALMYNCHALLLTSKTEGSPQVIKEAMACGCPIVSVDVGDVAERVSGVEGCYVVPTREPSTIAEALKKAIAFEGKTNGRSHIIEMGLSNEQVAERLMAIYQSLV